MNPGGGGTDRDETTTGHRQTERLDVLGVPSRVQPRRRMTSLGGREDAPAQLHQTAGPHALPQFAERAPVARGIEGGERAGREPGRELHSATMTERSLPRLEQTSACGQRPAGDARYGNPGRQVAQTTLIPGASSG